MADTLDSINTEDNEYNGGTAIAETTGYSTNNAANEDATEEATGGTTEDTTEEATDYGSAYSAVANAVNNTDTVSVDYDPTKTNDLLSQTSQIEDGTSYVDAAKSTVAGQLASLMNSESPLMKQAESRGEVEASKRGQLGSSMGVGATQAALYAAAVPIAQQDAETYATAQQQQQASDYAIVKAEKETVLSTQILNMESEIAQNKQNINNAFEAMMAGADANTQASLKELSNAYAQSNMQLQAELDAALTKATVDTQTKQDMYTQAASVLQNYQITVENLMSNASFLALGTDAMVNTLNQFQNLATNQVKFLGSVVGMGEEFEDLIEHYFPEVITEEQLSGD